MSKTQGEIVGDALIADAAQTVQTTHEQLATAMDFDHIIRVNENGTIDSKPNSGKYAPTVESAKEPGRDDWTDDLSQLGEWKLMTGHTGQYGYNGHVMHASEYIGGGMASAILDHPGLYVAVAVDAPCGYDGTTDCEEDSGCNCEPAGWAVAYIAD